jgi:hypothetical protein
VRRYDLVELRYDEICLFLGMVALKSAWLGYREDSEARKESLSWSSKFVVIMSRRLKIGWYLDPDTRK